MTPTALPTGAPWLRRALVVSAVLHLAVTLAAWWISAPKTARMQLVDVEIAPEAPRVEALPQEVEKQQASATEPAATEPLPPPAPEPPMATTPIDAGVPDAAIKPDAAVKPDAATKPDAAIDAGDAEAMVAMNSGSGSDPAAGSDSGSASGSAAGSNSGSGSAAGSNSGSGSAAGSNSGSGSAAGSNSGSGSNVPYSGSGSDSGSGSESLPAVAGAPTTAGTAANLLAYFPAGHVVTALVRFDRIRGTEWAQAAEKMFRPMPDYRGLFGDHDAAIADKLDTLVISTPQPRDATATTLVAHTKLGRAALRDLLSANPIKWSSAKGGMLGVRGGKLVPGDKRVVISPWSGWFLLAQPQDLGAMTAATTGDLDSAQPHGKLPSWVDGLRTIEAESGDPRGPALVVTLAIGGGRLTFPDLGLGVTSLPGPERVSLALELVPQGWLARGNIKFANEADAEEFVTSIGQAQTSLAHSIALKLVLKRQHVFSAIVGMSLAQTGARVSYATSLSVADSRALMAAVAVTLDQYFAHQRP